MPARRLSLLWLTAALLALAGPALAGEQGLGGSLRFYGGTEVVRRFSLPGGASSQTLRWRLAVNRTTVGQGAVTITSDDPWLRILVPAVERKVDARLAFFPETGDGWVEPVAIYPPPDALVRAFADESAGWVSPGDALRIGGVSLSDGWTRLGDADAVRRFRGSLILVPPTTIVDDVLARALLERAAAGAAVLALGVERAPWTLAEGEEPDSRVSGVLLGGLPAAALDAWGRGGSAWGTPLRAPEGNHEDLVPGRIRVLYPGSGKVILAQVRLLETLNDEPLAAVLLLRLLETAKLPAPRLSAPRTVAIAEGGLPAAIPLLFGKRLGEGPAVVVTNDGNPGAAIAEAKPPAVVFGSSGSLFLPDKGMTVGPGLDALKGARRGELLRFLTAAGLRVKSVRYWR